MFTTKSMMVALVMSLLLVASSAQANLFTFGDMETGGDATNPPSGWENTTPLGQESSVVGVSSDTMDGSAQSLILTGGTDAGYDYGARANYELPEGTYGGDYTLSYDWKGDIYTSFWADGSKKQADWQRSTEWATFSKTISVPAGTTNLAMTFYDNSGGDGNQLNSALFDNLSLTPEPSTMILFGIGGLILLIRRRK